MTLNKKAVKTEYYEEDRKDFPLFEGFGMQKSKVKTTSELSITIPNLYQFETVSSSRFADQTTGPVFSFWTQPKQFDWNFEQKNREQVLKQERNIDWNFEQRYKGKKVKRGKNKFDWNFIQKVTSTLKTSWS